MATSPQHHLGGEKITVHKGKKEVVILDYGAHPFHVDSKGRIIPNGFKVETYVSGYMFLASTQVDTDAQKVKYCFAWKDNEDINSGWKKSPTGALDAANKALHNLKHKYGTNGQLMIGVTYDPVQVRIREVFAEQLANLPESTSFPKAATKSSLRKRVKPTFAEEETAFALVKLTRQQRKAASTPTTSSSSAAAAAAQQTPKRARFSPARTKTPLNSAMATEELVDERSMQPLMYVPKEPTATPSKRRSESVNETYDDMALSSQQSLDLVGMDMSSQEVRAMEDKLFPNSQEDKDNSEFSSQKENSFLLPVSRESSLVDEKTNSSQLSLPQNLPRDASLLSQLLKDPSLLSHNPTHAPQQQTIVRDPSMLSDLGSLKLYRTDTQQSEPMLIEENSLQAWSMMPTGISSQ